MLKIVLQTVFLVCRGQLVTWLYVHLDLLCFGLYYGTSSVSCDCMFQQYLRLLSRERKIHPCNPENLAQGLQPEPQLNIYQERVTGESQTHILYHLSLSTCHEKAGQFVRAVFLSPLCFAVTYSRTLIIAGTLSRTVWRALCRQSPPLFHLIFEALWVHHYPFPICFLSHLVWM